MFGKRFNQCKWDRAWNGMLECFNKIQSLLPPDGAYSSWRWALMMMPSRMRWNEYGHAAEVPAMVMAFTGKVSDFRSYLAEWR